MTSNMIYIVALGVGFKCPRKIHLNTQWGGGVKNGPLLYVDTHRIPLSCDDYEYARPRYENCDRSQL